MDSGKKGWRNYFILKDINSVIRILTISDVLMVGGFGLVAPIFAIFVENTIKGGIEVIGIASAIFLLTKSVMQIPIAGFIDKIIGEKDDFWVVFASSIIMSAIPLLYLIISTPLHLYFVQFIYGLAAAAVFPAWMAIFTRHIDKQHEGLEWGAYQTLVDISSAATASLGGFFAAKFGFGNLFILVSILSFVGSLFLMGIYRDMKTENS